MPYCYYNDYVQLGGTMDIDAYNIWGPRACRRIDRLTLGRAAARADLVHDQLADACARIADLLEADDAAQRSHIGLSGASTDGVSENYTDPTSVSRAVDKRCYAVLSDALGCDPYGLLYMGVD